MNLSKSRYCRGLQCKKMLWLEANKPEQMEDVNNESILEQGNLVHEVARYLFGNHINIKSSTELKDVYINDASYQYYVLSNLGFDVTKCSIVVINNKYVRNGKIDLDKLFLKIDITSDVISLQEKVKENIADINEYMNNTNEPIDDIDIKCFTPYSCPFFKYCTRNLPNDNVFKIAKMFNRTKIKLYKLGKYTYQDLLNSDINEFQKQQIEFELYNKDDYIDKDGIKRFLDTLTYPLYFLDFETYQMPIPLYDRVKPYEQVPFQYSLHYILEENDRLRHVEFLAEPGSDPRRSLAERVVQDSPKDVCTLAYNMSFEKTVIKNLANIYPDLSNHLMNIHDNMKDLMIPFKNRDYYTKEMDGSYSIKYVLPALFPNDESLNYHNLDLIHNGSEAMNSYVNLENMSEEDKEIGRASCRERV